MDWQLRPEVGPEMTYEHDLHGQVMFLSTRRARLLPGALTTPIPRVQHRDVKSALRQLKREVALVGSQKRGWSLDHHDMPVECITAHQPVTERQIRHYLDVVPFALDPVLADLVERGRIVETRDGHRAPSPPRHGLRMQRQNALRRPRGNDGHESCSNETLYKHYSHSEGHGVWR